MLNAVVAELSIHKLKDASIIFDILEVITKLLNNTEMMTFRAMIGSKFDSVLGHKKQTQGCYNLKLL